jgi:hypothetical protein
MQTQDGILGHPIYQPCHYSSQLSHQDQNHSREIPSLLGHQEENKEEDYSWLDTYTHVKPQALGKLRKATMKSSFSFADSNLATPPPTTQKPYNCRISAIPNLPMIMW